MGSSQRESPPRRMWWPFSRMESADIKFEHVAKQQTRSSITCIYSFLGLSPKINLKRSLGQDGPRNFVLWCATERNRFLSYSGVIIRYLLGVKMNFWCMPYNYHDDQFLGQLQILSFKAYCSYEALVNNFKYVPVLVESELSSSDWISCQETTDW